ncbi:uncharacterized protein [Drosophila tropicalis]|uniref:uncharacterized protein n=1 Tax=Drosophila tropicalis TaxID=46794 RepID=UPI0035AC1E44
MEMDVNRHDASNLMTISLRCSNNNNGTSTTCPPASTLPTTTTTSPSTSTRPPSGCCGILSRLFCVSRHKATQSVAGSEQCSNLQEPLTLMQRKAATTTTTITNSIVNRLPATQKRSRRTPQEIYFESRGKSCKKLLKFNGNSNKILLYPEEGWARTASSSYWTITPCWWQPNRCRIVECSGTQRQATRARMVPLEQQGSLLIAGHFRRTTASASATAASSSASGCASASASATVSQLTDKSQPACNDEFKLYLTSNISMEDYNMGYCLTGFVERRCQLTNTFQMTHFAVIKRQWPQPSNLSNS